MSEPRTRRRGGSPNALEAGAAVGCVESRERTRARDAGARLGDAQRALWRAHPAQGREPAAHRIVQAARRAASASPHIGDATQRGRGSAGNHAPGAGLRGQRARTSPARSSCRSRRPSRRSLPSLATAASSRCAARHVNDCVAAARERAQETGAVFVHPFDDPDVIIGQATLGVGCWSQVPDLATVIVPIGGGGLISGVAGAVELARPQVRGDRRPGRGVRAPTRRRSRPERRSRWTPESTIADGIAVKRPGRITLPLVQRWVNDVVVVSEEDTAEAMVLLLDARSSSSRARVPLASPRCSTQSGCRLPRQGSTVVVLSGGNVNAGPAGGGSRAAMRPRSAGACGSSRSSPTAPAGWRRCCCASRRPAATCSRSSMCARPSTSRCARPASS